MNAPTDDDLKTCTPDLAKLPGVTPVPVDDPAPGAPIPADDPASDGIATATREQVAAMVAELKALREGVAALRRETRAAIGPRAA